MPRGRREVPGLRAWILEQLAGGQQLTMLELQARFRKSDIDAIPNTMYKAMQKLVRGVPKLVYVVRYVPRNGRHQPIYALGCLPDATPEPSQTYNARYMRAARAKLHAEKHADRLRLETERRRALKRRPEMDALTAALFGRPSTSPRKAK